MGVPQYALTQNRGMKSTRWMVFAAVLAGLAGGLAALGPDAAGAAEAGAAAAPRVVGSKRFTESYILGEIVRLQLSEAGLTAQHRQGLGNTGILEQALASGAVDVYPEYTGTIVRELLHRQGNPGLDELNAWLAPRGLKAAVPLGFNNSYALALRETEARRLNLHSISDLKRLGPTALKLGLSHEFQARADGWPALVAAYGLPQQPGGALDHGLAYEALRDGQVDLIDVYATDAKVGRYGLRVQLPKRPFGGQPLAHKFRIERPGSADDAAESNTVEVTIYNLRKKLGPDVIQTVRGVGYRIAA